MTTDNGNTTDNQSPPPRLIPNKPELPDHVKEMIRERRARNIEHAEKAPGLFLQAWVRGVRKVGPECFGFSRPHYGTDIEAAASLDEVTNKWQVAPIMDMVKRALRVKSGGETALLAIMYSFYNSEDGADMMEQIEIRGFADYSSKLDLESREIVAELLKNYNGW